MSSNGNTFLAILNAVVMVIDYHNGHWFIAAIAAGVCVWCAIDAVRS